jgi:cytochrome d ubiquinol oxidase subunit I
VLRTEDAVSPSVSTATVALSLGAFMLLYTILGVVDFVLMRRYARVDPPELAPDDEAGEALQAPSY